MQQENMHKEDFFEHLLHVKDKQDRQQYYFDQVKDVVYTHVNKSLQE